MAKAKIFVRELTTEEKSKLTSIKKRRAIDYALRQRADIIILSSEGCEVKLIEHRTGLDQSNIIKWIRRFNQGGIEALGDIPKSGRPKTITKDIELKIAALALLDPKEINKPFTTWTLETIQKEAISTGIVSSISRESTRRVLKNCGITLQRSCTWKTSNDPNYESKKKTLLMFI